MLPYLNVSTPLPCLDVQEQFRYYACFGGVPHYLEQVDPFLSLKENLAGLYFDPTGLLYAEPENLLRQEINEPAIHNSVLRAIAGGANRPNLISEKTGVGQTTLPKYLKTLVDLDIVERIVPFGVDPASSKRAVYQICDASFDFWFTFVMPRVSEIERGLGDTIVKSIPGKALDAYFARRFVRVCADWLVTRSADELSIPVDSVGPWWKDSSKRKAYDDVDMLAGSRDAEQLMMCKCEYCERVDHTRVLRHQRESKLQVDGYKSKRTVLFTGRSASDLVQGELAGRDDVIVVTLDDMYASLLPSTRA